MIYQRLLCRRLRYLQYFRISRGFELLDYGTERRDTIQYGKYEEYSNVTRLWGCWLIENSQTIRWSCVT